MPALPRLLLCLGLAIATSHLAAAADPVVPTEWEASDVDPRSGLTAVERQTVQDALMWVGVYTGPQDGHWSPATEQALRSWGSTAGISIGPRLSRAELLALLVAAKRARAEAGWVAGKDPNTGFWFGWPEHSAKPPMPIHEEGSYGSDYEARGPAGLKLATRVTTSDPRALIANLLKPQAAALIGSVRPTFRIDRPDRQVAMLVTGTGGSIYIRYERVGDEWHGFTVTGPASIAPFWLVGPIGAEFTAGPDPATPEPTEETAPVIAEVAALAARPEWTRTVAGKLPSGAAAQLSLRATGSGTTFVISRDGLMLTNAHVVNGCERLKLADGTEVAPVAADRERDLALVKAAHGFGSALNFRREQTVDLGEKALVFGFPYFRLVSESLNITDGVVTSLTGLRGNHVQFQMSANLQPGNSGGPVLDEAGNVIGVSVAILNSLAVARLTGSIPQGMNYAVRGAEAEAFLREHGVEVGKGTSARAREFRDIAKATTPLVFPLLCYN